MDDRRFGMTIDVPSYYPDERKKYILEDARRKLGYQLFMFLWECKLPAVIDIQEAIITKGLVDRVEYTVTTTMVQHRHVVIASPPEPMYWYMKPTKIPSLLRRIKGWFHA
jgi:hypothetical protein